MNFLFPIKLCDFGGGMNRGKETSLPQKSYKVTFFLYLTKTFLLYYGNNFFPYLAFRLDLRLALQEGTISQGFKAKKMGWLPV